MLNIIHFIPLSLVPQEIRAQGPRTEAAFKEAIEKGIMLLGQDRAGKTSLKKFPLGIPFDPEEENTVGVKLEATKFEVEVDQVKNWQCTDQKKLDLSVFREDIAKITAEHMKAMEGRKQTSHSDEITNYAAQVKEQGNGSYSSKSQLEVTILGSSWGFPRFDSSFFSQELAIQLAKFAEVKVRFLVPQNSSGEIDKGAAARYGVTIAEVEEQPGFYDPTDWLLFPPRDLTTDIVVGAGEKLGKIANLFKKQHQCKNIYVANDPFEERRRELVCGELWEDNGNVGLSRTADLAVAPGPKISDNLSASLRGHEKHVFKLTPGILSEFSNVKQATAEQTKFRILMLGSGNPDNFEQESLNTAAQAVAELNDKSYHLLFAGAAEGEHERFAEKFSQCGVSKSQRTIRSLPKSREKLKSLFCEVDLAIMPSSEQGFGMMGLAALSSGLPVLVHEDSGFGEALKEVKYGTSSTMGSEDANTWAKAIKRVRKTERKIRLQEATSLRSDYDEKYSWEKQCGALVQKILTMVSAQPDQTTDPQS
ncbi:uncharacterized protein LOC110043869 [Orbicella faveolata]|uniref:uncharacterized protein LOC110043869 n=1 Tax=Orbicella faveolata TaxID=48498 RepID=UPI0009E2C0A3|nr:uncharacterized protein LOC110043869 [Orbicella faveolata]